MGDFMFKDVLNNYLNKLKISSKELSLKSNISESVISRYRSGSRVPNNEQILKLATAIYNIIIVLIHLFQDILEQMVLLLLIKPI